MAVRTAPGGVRTDWSIIEIDNQRHGKLFKQYYKTEELESAILNACHICPKCGGTGMADSGGVQPWGEPIEIECDCQFEDPENDKN